MCCNCTCNNKVKEPIVFMIGDGGSITPSNGASHCIDPDIKYLKYNVSKNGYGTLIENILYERLPNGGFQLLGGAIFTTGEIFTITFYN